MRSTGGWRVEALVLIPLIGAAAHLRAADEQGDGAPRGTAAGLRLLAGPAEGTQTMQDCSLAFDLRDSSHPLRVFPVEVMEDGRHFVAWWESPSHMELVQDHAADMKSRETLYLDPAGLAERFGYLRGPFYLSSGARRNVPVRIESLELRRLSINKEVQLWATFAETSLSPQPEPRGPHFISSRELESLDLLSISEPVAAADLPEMEDLRQAGILPRASVVVRRFGSDLVHVQWREPRAEGGGSFKAGFLVTRDGTRAWIPEAEIIEDGAEETSRYEWAADLDGDGWPELAHAWHGRYWSFDAFYQTRPDGLSRCMLRTLGSD